MSTVTPRDNDEATRAWDGPLGRIIAPASTWIVTATAPGAMFARR